MYASTVWKKISSKLDPSLNPSEDSSLEHRFKNWWNIDRAHTHESLPSLYVFTIWETRNRELFQNTYTPLEIIKNSAYAGDDGAPNEA